MQKVLLLVTILLVSTFSLKFVVDLSGGEKQCFYEVLDTQQKYSIDLTPKNSIKYELQVSQMVKGSWNSVYYKATETSYQNVNVHKLASTSATYSFCVKNIQSQLLRMSVNIQSGLQLMEFELLPDKDDSENLNRELNWIDSQKIKLYETLSRMQGLRAATQGITNIMSTKIIGFAILGLVAIVVVNLLFYRELKKTFKERKLI